MIRLLADENLNNNIVRGVRLRQPDIDLVRVQDVGLSGADDPTVLAWAAEQQRILLTHDVATITAFAYERVRTGKSMPGVFEVGRTVALRSAIDDIVLLATCSDGKENGRAKCSTCRRDGPRTADVPEPPWRAPVGVAAPVPVEAGTR